MRNFSRKDTADAKKLLEEKGVLSVLFSEGTYQIEVLESKKPKKTLWPFLQVSDTGEVIDAFCTCEAAERKGSCVHLVAAYLSIMNGEPLHVRFRESLWHEIGLICLERHGDKPEALKKVKGRLEGYSPEGKRVFSLSATKPKAEKKVKELLFDRPVETEETSLKFSNLPSEELALWRDGRPSEKFRFELSFWSDLAKWWFLMQKEGEAYQISFSEEMPPELLTFSFPGLEVECLLEWPRIIPSLKGVDSPLPVHTHPMGELENVVFLPEKGSFALEFAEEGGAPLPDVGEEVGEWLLVPGKGFFPREVDPLLTQKVINPDQVSHFLERHLKLVQQLLKGVKIHPTPASLQYSLSFDAEHNLQIKAYLFEKGDLAKKGTYYYGKWVYLPEKGFFPLENQLFESAEVAIPKEEISDFIDRHRVWLQGFDGFQPHVSGVESHLGFAFDPKGDLAFFIRIEFTEEKENIIDLGDWIFAKGKGFYAKITSRPGAFVKAGTKVKAGEISNFIHEHRDELEPIPGFFSPTCPLEKSGLDIGFNEMGRIKVTPEFFFSEGTSADEVKIFGDYTFVEGAGFALIPHASRLPESYKKEKVVDSMAEPYFVSYELDLLYPHVLTIDPKLKKPEEISIRLHHLQRQPRAKTGQWVMQLMYETDVGEIAPNTLWEGIWKGASYLFTNGGLVFVRDKQFDWLRHKTKKQWLKNKTALRLTTLEFLRLSAFEEILEPEGTSIQDRRTRKLLADFLALKAPSEINLTGLKSDLRPYQKTGVEWLWFLYSYGVSGLLCDEMGLGKTHQAMALIAGIKNVSDKDRPKFLVVCPTSVIYHWEKLIHTFLPNVKPYIFHGVNRKLSLFTEGGYDLLLTSYGISRTENEDLSKIHFDLVVFDELQMAKNEKSLTYKALQKIKATMRLGLSGTPIENRLLELKALFDLVLPTYLPSQAAFREFFVGPIEKYHDVKKQKLLGRLIRPFLLRRKKSEVLTELPEKIEEISICDLSNEQKTLYKEIVRNYREPLLKELADKSSPPPVAHIFSMLSKLKQVCNHPALITKDIKNYKDHSSGKWDLFLELLNETRDSGQKLVVFSQFLGMLDIMGAHLKGQKIGFAEIRGATRDRKEQVERFATDPKCEVFLGSLQAAGVGIDLIAASVVIHYDRWWNPAKENQATDRVHRMGQKRGVQVFKLVAKNSIEEHIHLLIERKKKLASGVIGFDEQDQIKGFEREELVELLKLLEKDAE